MTGNGEHTTYQNADFSGGWFFYDIALPTEKSLVSLLDHQIIKM